MLIIIQNDLLIFNFFNGWKLLLHNNVLLLLVFSLLDKTGFWFTKDSTQTGFGGRGIHWFCFHSSGDKGASSNGAPKGGEKDKKVRFLEISAKSLHPLFLSPCGAYRVLITGSTSQQCTTTLMLLWIQQPLRSIHRAKKILCKFFSEFVPLFKQSIPITDNFIHRDKLQPEQPEKGHEAAPGEVRKEPSNLHFR